MSCLTFDVFDNRRSGLDFSLLPLGKRPPWLAKRYESDTEALKSETKNAGDLFTVTWLDDDRLLDGLQAWRQKAIKTINILAGVLKKGEHESIGQYTVSRLETLQTYATLLRELQGYWKAHRNDIKVDPHDVKNRIDFELGYTLYNFALSLARQSSGGRLQYPQTTTTQQPQQEWQRLSEGYLLAAGVVRFILTHSDCMKLGITELTPEFLTIMQEFLLAASVEISLLPLLQNVQQFPNEGVAKKCFGLCQQAVHIYKKVQLLLPNTLLLSLVKPLKAFLNIKLYFYTALAFFCGSFMPENQKKRKNLRRKALPVFQQATTFVRSWKSTYVHIVEQEIQYYIDLIEDLLVSKTEQKLNDEEFAALKGSSSKETLDDSLDSNSTTSPTDNKQLPQPIIPPFLLPFDPALTASNMTPPPLPILTETSDPLRWHGKLTASEAQQETEANHIEEEGRKPSVELQVHVPNQNFFHKAPPPNRKVHLVDMCTELSRTQQKGEWTTCWYKLNNCKSGDIKLSYCIEDFDLNTAAGWATTKKLRVRVCEGRDLEAQDKSLYNEPVSDPYVKILVNEQIQQTTVKKETLNPVWNEEFDFDVTCHNRSMMVQVWDSDVTKDDDTMGHCYIPLTGIVSTCVILILDCTGNISVKGEEKSGVIHKMLSDFIHGSPLSDYDYGGVVMYSASQSPVLRIHRMTELGKAQLCKSIIDMSLNTNKCSAAICEGILKVMQKFGEWANANSVASHDVFVISDGVSIDSTNQFSNWFKYHDVLSTIRTQRVGSQQTKVHCFGVGKQPDKYLLQGLSSGTGGDFSFVSTSDSSAVDALRSWFIKHVASLFLRVASDVVMSVECPKGVTVGKIGTYPIMARIHEMGYLETKWEDPTDIRLPDITVGATTHMYFQLYVQPEVFDRYKTTLATFNIKYFDTRWLTERTVQVSATITSAATLLSPPHHLTLDRWTSFDGNGKYSLHSGTGTRYPLYTSNWLEPHDIVSTHNDGNLFISSTNLTMLTIPPNTSLAMGAIKPDHSEEIDFVNGVVWFTVGHTRALTVKILKRYHITAAAGTMGKIVYNRDSKELTVQNLEGSIELILKGDNRSIADTLALKKLMQTTATHASDKFSTAMAADDTFLKQWMDFSPHYVQKLAIVNSQINRTVAYEHMQMCADLLAKGGKGCTESKENRRCRKFLCKHFISEARRHLTNSLSGTTDMCNICRKQLDWVYSKIETDEKILQDTIHDVFSLTRSVMYETCIGNSGAYLTGEETAFISMFEDEHQKERRIAACWKVGKTFEQLRREDVVAKLFPLWDTDGSGFIEYNELQQVILSFQGVTNGQSEDDHVITPHLRFGNNFTGEKLVLEKWNDLVESGHITNALDLHQLQVLMLFLGEDYSPDEFDDLIKHVKDTLGDINQLTDGTRRTRAVINLFNIWDVFGRGYILLQDFTSTIEKLPDFDDDLERMEPAIRSNAISEYGADGAIPPPSEDRVRPSRFNSLITELLYDLDDTEYHDALVLLREEVEKQRKDALTVDMTVVEEARMDNRDQLIQWDLKHSLDGITKKHVESFLLRESATDHIEQVCRPVCLLIGIQPKKARSVFKRRSLGFDEEEEDTRERQYFTTLKDEIAKDWQSFLTFLRSFPTMSVSKKQVAQIEGFVCSKMYDSNPVKEFSMLLSALMDWVKVIIKICKLNRDWVFGDTGQARPKVKPQIDDKADISQEVPHLLTQDTKKAKKKSVLKALHPQSISPDVSRSSPVRRTPPAQAAAQALKTGGQSDVSSVFPKSVYERVEGAVTYASATVQNNTFRRNRYHPEVGELLLESKINPSAADTIRSVSPVRYKRIEARKVGSPARERPTPTSSRASTRLTATPTAMVPRAPLRPTGGTPTPTNRPSSSAISTAKRPMSAGSTRVVRTQPQGVQQQSKPPTEPSGSCVQHLELVQKHSRSPSPELDLVIQAAKLTPPPSTQQPNRNHAMHHNNTQSVYTDTHATHGKGSSSVQPHVPSTPPPTGGFYPAIRPHHTNHVHSHNIGHSHNTNQNSSPTHSTPYSTPGYPSSYYRSGQHSHSSGPSSHTKYIPLPPDIIDSPLPDNLTRHTQKSPTQEYALSRGSTPSRNFRSPSATSPYPQFHYPPIDAHSRPASSIGRQTSVSNTPTGFHTVPVISGNVSAGLSRHTQVELWLQHHELDEYVNTMKDNGFDDMDEFEEVVFGDADLLGQLVPKLGHRRKIQRLLNNTGPAW